MWQAVEWICALVAMACNPLPDYAAIQAAYEREASAGSPLHDKGLEVLQAECQDNGADGFLCEVTFISKGDPTERLYFDIVAVAGPPAAGSSRAACASGDATFLKNRS
jgi:hypothetical protein